MSEALDIPPLYKGRKWDFRMLELAQVVASWSRDPSTKIGAVIARPDSTVLSLGFNGFPRGCDDHPAIYADRERKYERVVHAELNAILTSAERPWGCTLYVYPPALVPGTCARCAAAIIQAGIRRVVHLEAQGLTFNERWRASYQEAVALYREAGIRVLSYPQKEFFEWQKAKAAASS
jgi:dCMP deaminase